MRRVALLAAPTVFGLLAGLETLAEFDRYWGPALVLTVALVAYLLGSGATLFAGAFAAVQAPVVYEVNVVPHEWTTYIPPRLLVPAMAICVATFVLAKRRKPLRNCGEIIAWMGGPQSVTQWAMICDDEVADWKAGNIPAGWHYRLALKARSEGYWIDPAALGLTRDGRPRAPGDRSMIAAFLDRSHGIGENGPQAGSVAEIDPI